MLYNGNILRILTKFLHLGCYVCERGFFLKDIMNGTHHNIVKAKNMCTFSRPKRWENEKRKKKQEDKLLRNSRWILNALCFVSTVFEHSLWLAEMNIKNVVDINIYWRVLTFNKRFPFFLNFPVPKHVKLPSNRTVQINSLTFWLKI